METNEEAAWKWFSKLYKWTASEEDRKVKGKRLNIDDTLNLQAGVLQQWSKSSAKEND